jgi:two-component system sensor histidine kinase AlgZ
VSHIIDLTERTRPTRVWLVVAGWTAAATVTALVLRAQVGIPLVSGFIGSLINYYTLGLLVWIVCRANARYGWWQRPSAVAILIHTALGIAALATWSMTQLLMMRLFVGPGFWDLVYAGTWMFQLSSAVATYAAGLGLGLMLQGLDREAQRRQREAVLEMAAREAELMAIKAQLQPHFLLNSLNSILVLIKHDTAQAQHMVTRLASLLHSVFDRLDERLVPLDPELETVRHYLEIEQIRFHDRLRFTIDSDERAGAVLVPPLLLQPLVENAMRHGIEPNPQPGEIQVTAKLVDSRLRITVTDSGGPATPRAPSTSGTGRGLELTRRRLAAVYGDDDAALHLQHHASGVSVTLDLPAKWHVH